MGTVTTSDFIRLPEVRRRTALSKTEIYRRIKAGDFPKGRRLSHRVAVWSSDQIEAWKLRQMGVEDMLS